MHLAVNEALGLDEQVGPALSDACRWGARYFQVRPAADVPTIDVHFWVDSPHPAFFSLMVIKDDDFAMGEDREVGLEFARNLANDSYDKVVVVVAGLDHDVNLRYAFNAVDPVLRILDPLAARPTYVGSGLSPEKFIIRLEVLSATAEPLLGIDADEFTFTVGTEVVPPEDVLAPAYVQGQYWFVVQAPPQDADGPYDLTVAWSDLSATEVDAVMYAPRTDTDNVLVVDRSGSMNDPASKIIDAKAAAKLYVDSWRTGDKIGVVSFNCSVSDPVDLTLRNWNDANRDLALDRIDDIVAGGLTSIGTGLSAGLAELLDEGVSDHDWAIVLLSDGLNTCGDDIADFLETYDALSKAPKVHTVAIGPDANRPDLENLANETGGIYRFASEPAGGGGDLEPETTDFRREIADIFREVSERIAGHQRVLSVRGTVASQQTNTHPFVVDAGASELVVAVSWDTALSQLHIKDPSGVSTYAPFKQTPEHRVYRVGSPLPGEWEIVVESSARTADYLADAAVRSVLTMFLYLGLPVEKRIVGTPMSVLVALTDKGPVLAATVVAEIQYPSGSKVTLGLFDDGNHRDGKAGDGVYGNTLWATTEVGNYKVFAQATGSSAVVGEFVRQQNESFCLRADRNMDRDCLPDGYELRVGLDPKVDDGQMDPDGDGLDNCTEFRLGTHPLDPDTDDGGEADGSEVRNRRNPLEPGDDRVRAPRVYAQPEVGQVLVRFNRPANVVAYDIYRATGTTGVFQLHAQSYPATRPFQFTDRQLENGTLYRYQVVSIGRGGERSAPSDPCQAIPRLDPYPPHGLVVINGGVRTTGSTDVQITLVAGDDWAPEDSWREIRNPRAQASGVAEMRISNRAHFGGAVWEPYLGTRPWSLEPNPRGLATVYVQYRDRAGNESEIAHSSIRVAGVAFRRGDANADGTADISDAIAILGFLFLGSRMNECKDAADVNDDGKVDISDPVRLLSHLFLGSARPPEPFGTCGADLTADELDCKAFSKCP